MTVLTLSICLTHMETRKFELIHCIQRKFVVRRKKTKSIETCSHDKTSARHDERDRGERETKMATAVEKTSERFM